LRTKVQLGFHLGFHLGPAVENGMAAMGVAKQLFTDNK
jgi:hypothetical protein